MPQKSEIFIGKNFLHFPLKKVEGTFVHLDGESYYKISNYEQMRPFFISIVSDSDHWMFISSNGGLTAGRKNPDFSLFPYYTDDKIADNADITGSKSIFIVEKHGQSHLWEPFSERYSGLYKIQRNLYKGSYGDRIIFEEINEDLQVTFQYGWFHSESFGFIKKSKVTNDSGEHVQVNILDGIQNILPAGIDRKFQTEKSNLVNAYKKNELISDTGIGIFSLSANIVDRPEPSESLKATTVWSVGITDATYLISSLQLNQFRRGLILQGERDIRAERGAYFLNKEEGLNANSTSEWCIVAEVNQSTSDLMNLDELLKSQKDISKVLQSDINKAKASLKTILRESDGIQLSGDQINSSRHTSNVLFNVMRGGIFNNEYYIERDDFIRYVKSFNRIVAENHNTQLQDLPANFTSSELLNKIRPIGDKDLLRLSFEYLPLYFSRRHGDPSRPWNMFSIDTKTDDGLKALNYEGNWRDIFQNWEALSLSFPGFIESMIIRFLNASTADGYNPYRIMRSGIDWEVIEPNDPWSFIGYWGDHQIIYLLKLLELSDKFHPGFIYSMLNDSFFCFANVPYRIKTYEELIANPFDTITFDESIDERIKKRVDDIGSDGKLVWESEQTTKKVNLIEKLLIPLLAKLGNFIPEGGIWLNTQRPEWNDANNALVGYGMSMVTLQYIRRYVQFMSKLISSDHEQDFFVSLELKKWFESIAFIFEHNISSFQQGFDAMTRRKMMDALGIATAVYNRQIYNGHSGEKASINTNSLITFINHSLQAIDQSIKTNKRQDKLYHAYNLLNLDKENSCDIDYLYEMLEGQVAALSSGLLSTKEAVEVLDAMKKSKLFREDQYSYLLYPDRELPKFHKKNTIPKAWAKNSLLLAKLNDNGNQKLIQKDVTGAYHFTKEIKNGRDIALILGELKKTGYEELVSQEGQHFIDLFENMFNHKSFTGRSGTFYGYEGLNSIYWHMVSKLLLSVQENIYWGYDQQAETELINKLIEHYYEIRAGIGYNKTPDLYGAFPIDPYSHTPGNKGAQQPGMTGQVKEDILTRFGELGVRIIEGKIAFNGLMLRASEFIKHKNDLSDLGIPEMVVENFIAFTICSVPIIYRNSSGQEKILLTYQDGSQMNFNGLVLRKEESAKVFDREKSVAHVQVYIQPKLS